MKGTMLEGGSRVPLIVNWPGVTPAGKVNHDLTDFSDFFATFAELAGAKLPEGVTLDSHSFAPQIRGEKGTPRDWVYVELNGKSYVRDPRFKLTNGGELFDLSEAPFKEIPVAEDSTDPAAVAARKKTASGARPAQGRPLDTPAERKWWEIEGVPIGRAVNEKKFRQVKNATAVPRARVSSHPHDSWG